jgi:hypothetical protein
MRMSGGVAWTGGCAVLEPCTTAARISQDAEARRRAWAGG